MSDKNKDQNNDPPKEKPTSDSSDDSVVIQQVIDSRESDKEFFEKLNKSFTEKEKKIGTFARTATHEELIDAMEDIFDDSFITYHPKSEENKATPRLGDEGLIPVKTLKGVFYYKNGTDGLAQESEVDQKMEQKIRRTLSIIRKMADDLNNKISLIEKSYLALERKL